MSFILTSGPQFDKVDLIHAVNESGHGTVTSHAGHDWAAAADAMSSISQTNDQTDYLVLLEGYLANTDEIARTLRSPPKNPKANPADLIARLLTERGPQALPELTGCFVLVAVNLKTGQLLATRDRCGGRTLYFHQGTDRITFATRSAWVIRAANLEPEPNPTFLTGKLALQGAPQPGHSAFKAVTELMPGEVLTVSGNQHAIERPPLQLDSDFDYRHPGDCVARFLELLNQAVATTLPDTGDVACMLSGGLDSGPIAVLADRQLAERGQRMHVTSWSLIDYPDADEQKWIRDSASVLRAPAQLIDGSTWLPFGRLDDSVHCPDLPLYNGFRALVNNCYQRAGELGCKVILNGNAGDEIYAPLNKLNIDRLRRRQWAPLWRDLVRLWQRGGLRQLLTDPSVRHPLGQIARLGRTNQRPPAWLTREAQQYWQPKPEWPPEASSCPHPEYTRRLFGPSMAFGRAHETEIPNRYGVDRRDPFHNEALLRFMHNAPFELSWKGGASKSIMRRAMRGLLPESIRTKPRTGLLNTFFQAGLEHNKKTIETLLFQDQTTWQTYIQPQVIKNQLQGNPTAPEALLSICIGHALWHRHWN